MSPAAVRTAGRSDAEGNRERVAFFLVSWAVVARQRPVAVLTGPDDAASVVFAETGVERDEG